MIKTIATSAGVVVAVLAGTVVGKTFAGSGGDVAGDPASAESVFLTAEVESDTKGDSDKDVTFYKFSREFVVPIMQSGSVRALIILNINLEIEESMSSRMFSMDPKLRDNIMTTLIGLSYDGYTFQNMTNPETYESMRALILHNLQDVLADGIENVLIVDMAKQEL